MANTSVKRILADMLEEKYQMNGAGAGALSAVFKEEPPGLETFLYDSKYLNSLRPTLPYPHTSGFEMRLSPIQFNFIRSFDQVFKPDLYIEMVREFGEQWAPLPMKNMFAIEWGKGCPIAGELVYSSTDGKWIPVENAKSMRVASVDTEANNQVTTAESTESWASGRGNCIEVVTESGAVTKVYEGHRFLTRKDGWVMAKDLELGDRIANVTKLSIDSPIDSIPEEHIQLVGMWLIGAIDTDMYIYSSFVKAAERYCQLLDSQGIEYVVSESRYNSTLVRPTDTSVDKLKELQKKYGIHGATLETAKVPSDFFSLSDDHLRLFLSSIFSVGGVIRDKFLGIHSFNERFVRDLTLLMKRLGIRATCSKGFSTIFYQGIERDSYSWKLKVSTGRDLQDFHANITSLDFPDIARRNDSAVGHRRFRQVLNPGIYWDKVVAINEIGEHDYYDLSVPGLENYVSTDGLVAHNSGKDTVVRLGVVRIASLLGHMWSPQGYFNMPTSDTIHMLNVAATAPQARDAFFDPMKKLFVQNEHLMSMVPGGDPAEGANRIKLNNNILIISGNSMAENQEGMNLLVGVADEISAFKTKEEFKNSGDGRAAKGADQIVNFLQSSASSRFAETYKVAQISWPRYGGDAIEQAIAEGTRSIKELGDDSSDWYVSGPKATWDVKPGISRDNFKSHYDKDPETAAKMYECKPPKSTNIFIRDEVSIDMAFSEIKEEPITVEYYWGLPPSSSGLVDIGSSSPQEGWQVDFTFSEDLVPVPGALYCLHGDLAISGDRAGIAMSHVKSYRTSTADDDERPIVKNDFWFTFESSIKSNPPREVQIRWYRQLIWELIDKGFEISIVTTDGFQSVDMRQTLEAYGIDTGLLSLDRNDKVYQAFKDVILDARLESYRSNQSEDSLVMEEIKRLRKVKNKVDHLPSFSKDAADSLAGSVYNAIEAGGEEDGEDALDLEELTDYSDDAGSYSYEQPNLYSSADEDSYFAQGYGRYYNS